MVVTAGFLTIEFLILSAIVFWWGKLKVGDLGLLLRYFPIGIGITFLIWIAVQIISWLLTPAQLREILFDYSQLNTNGLTISLSHLIGLIIPTALLEEFVFRGFLLPQLLLKIRGPWRISLALIISQLFFAVTRSAIQLYRGDSFSSLPNTMTFTFLEGMILGFVYVETRNLFLCIGLNILLQDPLAIFPNLTLVPNPMQNPQWIILVLALFLYEWYSKSHKRIPQVVMDDVEDYEGSLHLKVFERGLYLLLTGFAVALVVLLCALTLKDLFTESMDVRLNLLSLIFVLIFLGSRNGPKLISFVRENSFK